MKRATFLVFLLACFLGLTFISFLSPNHQLVPQVQVSTTTTWQVASSGADAARRLHTDYWSTTYTENFAGDYDNVTYYEYGCGTQWTGVNIPKSSTINDAYITMYCRVTDTATAVKTQIHGELSSNSAAFSTSADFDGRTRTAASVTWDIGSAWTKDQAYTSTNITAIIQEIVNQAGWASGNNLTIFWDDFIGRSGNGQIKSAWTYDSNSTGAPKLTVTYTGNATPTIGSVGATTWSQGALGEVDNAYPWYTSYSVTVTYTDTDGYADLRYCELYLKASDNTTRAELYYLEDTQTVGINVGSTKWNTNSTAADFSRSGNNVVATWKFNPKWIADEEEDVDFLFFANDTAGASVNLAHNENFDVVVKLVVASFAPTDSRINKGSAAYLNGLIRYEDDPNTGTASVAISPPDYQFFNVSIHDAAHAVQEVDNTISSGSFDVLFLIPDVVQNNVYHVYIDMRSGEYVDGDATLGTVSTSVIGDQVMVYYQELDDSRANVAVNIEFRVKGELLYDHHALGAGDTVTATSGALAWDAGNTWFDGVKTQATIGDFTFNISSASEASYTITSWTLNASAKVGVWDRVNIMVFTASDNRININDIANFTVTGVYQYDGTVWAGTSTLNDTTTKGTVNIWYFSISAVTDTNYGLTAFSQNASSPYVIWDRVAVTLSPSTQRVNVGSAATITRSGIYEYDSAGFGGTITLNDTTTKSVIANYTYTTLSLAGDAFGITAFTSNNVTVIFDKVKIDTFSVTDNRININATASFTVSGIYWFDSVAWTGTYTLNETTTKTVCGRWNFTVSSITDATYGLTSFNMTVSDLYVIWDSLQVYNFQPVQYVANGTFQYQTQVRYGYDLADIDNATLGLEYPNGTSVSFYSNTTGWLAFVLDQNNATSGNFSIYGIDDNIYTITLSESNSTFSLYQWTLDSQDIVGTTLTDTNINITQSSINVWNGTSTAIYVPTASYNISVLWLQNLSINTTDNVTISSDMTTTLNCSAYPYLTGWVASDATISSATFASNILSVSFSSGAGTYLLVASYPSQPTYIINRIYDLATDYTPYGYLVMTHYSNETLYIAYQTWGIYVESTTEKISTSTWDAGSCKWTLTLTGSSGATGTTEINCGSFGNPPETGGWSATAYAGTTFTGTYVFSSTVTTFVKWSVSGTTPTGGSSSSSEVLHLTVGVLFGLPNRVLTGQTVQGKLNVTWTGETKIYLWQIYTTSEYGNWSFHIDSMPIGLTLAPGGTGFASVNVTLSVPGDLEVGTYYVPCLVTFNTISSRTRTVASTLTFDVVAPPPNEIPSTLIMAFVVGFAIVFISFFARGKRSRS